jgi:hypothetical protein
MYVTHCSSSLRTAAERQRLLQTRGFRRLDQKSWTTSYADHLTRTLCHQPPASVPLGLGDCCDQATIVCKHKLIDCNDCDKQVFRTPSKGVFSLQPNVPSPCILAVRILCHTVYLYEHWAHLHEAGCRRVLMQSQCLPAVVDRALPAGTHGITLLCLSVGLMPGAPSRATRYGGTAESSLRKGISGSSTKQAHKFCPCGIHAAMQSVGAPTCDSIPSLLQQISPPSGAWQQWRCLLLGTS